MELSRPHHFVRALLVASLLHAVVTAIAFFVLLALTSGGGEGKPDSRAIELAGGALRILAIPAAWLAEKALNPTWSRPPAFGILVALRVLNSLTVGAIAAWAWTWAMTRRPERIRPNNYFMN